MYAIIETGGKQYRVEEGSTIRVEKLPADKGETVTFDRVLFCKSEEAVNVGAPYLDNCRVEGKVLGNGRGRKITVYKYKPKKNYSRKQGHRQPYSDVKIEKINL